MSTSVVPGRAPARTPCSPSDDVLEGVVVREHGDADVGLPQRLVRASPAARAAFDERLGLRGRAVPDRERKAARRGSAPRSARPSSRGPSDALLQHPSAVHLQVHAVHAAVLEQEHRRVRRSRPSSRSGRSACARRTASSTSGLPAHSGVSPTMPGMDRVDADRRELHARASARGPRSPPFTVVTVVEPGYGRRSARPPKRRIERLRVEPRHERVDDLRVADELERHEPYRAVDVVVADRVLVALDRREHEVVDRPDVRERRRRSTPARRGRGAPAHLAGAVDSAGDVGAALAASGR